METIEIGGSVCRLVRSAKRRTVCIRIADDGMAELLIPSAMSVADARAIGEKYRDWIRTRCRERQNLNEKREAFALSVGDRVRCLGGWRIITAHDAKTVGYDASAFYVPRGMEGERLRQAVMQIYRLCAKNYITARVSELSARMGLEPVSVKINAAKSHWATCSKKNTLNFTWYAIMADPGAIDYIIIHELCHMREFNHSPRFWALVGSYCPDYERHKRRLAELWREIQAENWE